MLCLDRSNAIAPRRSENILTKPRETRTTPNLERGSPSVSRVVVLLAEQALNRTMTGHTETRADALLCGMVPAFMITPGRIVAFRDIQPNLPHQVFPI